MTGAAEILSELQRRGVSVRAEGGALKLKPAKALDTALLERVREAKAEILRAIRVRPVTCAPSCYEVDPGRWIHHPWDGCNTPIPAGLMERLGREIEKTCWHCGGNKTCRCIVCWNPDRDAPGECLICHGSGLVAGWIQ